MLFVGPFTLILYSCVAENKEFYLSTVLATYSCPVLSHYYLVLMNNYYFSPMAYLTWFSQLQRDWPLHKKFCKEKAKQRISYELTPER